MNLAKQISDLVVLGREAAKQSHQKKEYNKTLSKLEDALAWARQIELDPVDEILNTASSKTVGCTCLPGAVSVSCLVHSPYNILPGGPK